VSGILGLFNLDGQPVEFNELRDMASLLTRRGPERTGIWHSGSVGLGHTLLATTPEMLVEDIPLEHPQSGCVITGDVRLDNREELLARLRIDERPAATGDAGLVLAAYLEWGEACVEHFLGDFAFAVWDPRRRQLFCARDHMGMRQLIYHHSPRRFFAFATEPRAILVLPQVPYRVNEARIADYLVKELEGVDKTSTFFEQVYRLPPAHSVTVTQEGMRARRYWAPEARPELRLSSDEEYAEAFLEVFTAAVRSRLRTVGPVGSMLSGGVDSGSVVAVASRLLAAEGRGPLFTFSAISPDGEAEPETRAILAASTIDGLEPTTVSYGALDDLLPELEELVWDVDEPFDGSMTLVRAVYLSARR
jgi:asparagine synthase (glutamine-hydrolysing)